MSHDTDLETQLRACRPHLDQEGYDRIKATLPASKARRSLLLRPATGLAVGVLLVAGVAGSFTLSDNKPGEPSSITGRAKPALQGKASSYGAANRSVDDAALIGPTVDSRTAESSYPASPSANAPVDLDKQQLMVHNADMSLLAENVSQASTQAGRIMQRYKSVVLLHQVSIHEDRSQANLRFAVAVDQASKAMNELAGLGEVQYRNEGAENITEQVGIQEDLVREFEEKRRALKAELEKTQDPNRQAAIRAEMKSLQVSIRDAMKSVQKDRLRTKAVQISLFIQDKDEVEKAQRRSDGRVDFHEAWDKGWDVLSRAAAYGVLFLLLTAPLIALFLLVKLLRRRR